jgi:hypothetical protein
MPAYVKIVGVVANLGQFVELNDLARPCPSLPNNVVEGLMIRACDAGWDRPSPLLENPLKKATSLRFPLVVKFRGTKTSSFLKSRR